jgi:hypothetical protein
VSENPTPFRKAVAVDFDGPIHAYTRGWQEGAIYDQPTDGALESVAQLAENYRVIVFTARDDLLAVKVWLRDHGFDPYVEDVTNRKPQAQVYIDDRAVYFDTALGGHAWEMALAEMEHTIIHHETQKTARGVGA